MAHFAKISETKEVLQVLTLNNSDMLNADSVEDESIGQQYLETHNNWPAQMWIQTSYNTSGNKHYINGEESADQSKALRGNYAGIGYTWDEDDQIFWPKKPYASWVKHIVTASWQAPITYPSVTTYNTTWTKADIDNGIAPEGTTAGDARNDVSYIINWDESAYQADNTTGWKATKHDDSIVSWNGTAWV
jgi:hypothetical protein